LGYLGKGGADDEPLELLTILDAAGYRDMLWGLTHVPVDGRLVRHFQAWIAEQVLPIFEAAYPEDTRVREQIEMLRNDEATDEEREAVRNKCVDALESIDTRQHYAAHYAACAAISKRVWEAAYDAADAEFLSKISEDQHKVSFQQQKQQLRKMLHQQD
jgi:hypothetical protein